MARKDVSTLRDEAAVAVEKGKFRHALERYAASNPRWTRERLDAFLADPQREVPDNAMGFFGIADPAERAALIEYLVRESKR